MHISSPKKQLKYHLTLISRRIIASLFLVLSFGATTFAATGGAEINLIVEGCNSNLVCETNIGENYNNCPLDCTITNTSTSDPVVSSTGGGGGPLSASSGGGGTIFSLSTPSIVANVTSATISFTSSLPAISILEWGTTSDYADGLISEVIYGDTHSFKLDNLSMGTRYYFSIKAKDSLNRDAGVVNQEFTTAIPIEAPPIPPPVVTVSNVSNFLITKDQESVELSWELPAGDVTVKVVRSRSGYPQDPFEGKVVYEGSGTSASDTDIILGETYYYSVFTKSADGFYSSGAIQSVGAGTGSSKGPFLGINSVFADNKIDTTENILSASDFIITQGEKKIYLGDQEIMLDGDSRFVISVSAIQIFDSVRDIIITLRAEGDNVATAGSVAPFSYLMALNKVNGTYEAVIESIPKGGSYVLRVIALDYTSRSVGSVESKINVTKFDISQITTDIYRQIKTDVAQSSLSFFALLLILLAGVVKLLKTVGNWL